jgi:hypothetical protein
MKIEKNSDGQYFATIQICNGEIGKNKSSKRSLIK